MNTEPAVQQSLGESRVRIKFNVAGDNTVDVIKSRTANLIDIVNDMKGDPHDQYSEKVRLISLAQTAYEEAAMWAVKAATF